MSNAGKHDSYFLYDFIFASTAFTIRAYGQLQYAYYTKDSSGENIK